MKHTKKYLDAMWVIENPDKYDAHDVLDAKRYTNAYIEGYTQALLIAAVVGRSEQYFCKECGKQIYAAETDICLACLEKGCGL